MRTFGLGRGLALTLVTGAAMFAHATDAFACGGCFGPTMTEQVVTDHRMVLSIGPTESVLWDQIQYSGAPAEFSWVLPVSGDVTVELGSSLFIDTLDSLTAPQVQAPPPRVVNCGCAPDYQYDTRGGAYADAAASADAATGTYPPPVTVVSMATVGPYETVTLRSTDATALTDWLNTNHYVIPPSLQPVIQSYVDMHMDFVALKLAPGEGVSAMQPVKIVYHTASMVLPLRMVAAGVGEKVGITLFVAGYGRYEAANFANGVIDANRLVWDWDHNTSNYESEFDREISLLNSGRGWVTQFSDSSNDVGFQNALASYCYQHNGYNSGNDPCYSAAYGTVTGAQDAGTGSTDADGGTAPSALELTQAARADWNLASHNNDTSVWFTRMRTSLLARYLDSDLMLQASSNGDTVARTLRAPSSIGNGPTICQYDYSCRQPAGGGGGTSMGSQPSCTASPAVAGESHSGRGLALALSALGLGALVVRRKRH